MTMKTLSHLLFMMLLLINACGDSASTGGVTAVSPTLKAAQTSVSMAVNYIRSIPVSGGNGRSRIHSVSDSSVAAVNISAPYGINGKIFQDVQITSKKIGITTVTVQDSAGTSQVQISVTVAIMVTSPVSVRVRAGRDEYVAIMGGTKPYRVQTAPNSAVATVELSTFSSMFVNGITPGVTSVTIQDSAANSNSIVIPIEVVGDPKFVEQGSVSFNSTVGNFSATGISIADLSIARLSGEGAGGWLYHSFYSGELITMMAYKMKDLTKADIVAISWQKALLSTGSVQIDTSYEKDEIAAVNFMFDVDISKEEIAYYRLTEGTVFVSQISKTFAVGMFSGNGILYRNESIVPGGTVTLTSGLFNVPLLEETFSAVEGNQKDERIIAALRRVHEKEIRRLKKRSVPLSK